MDESDDDDPAGWAEVQAEAAGGRDLGCAAMIAIGMFLATFLLIWWRAGGGT